MGLAHLRILVPGGGVLESIPQGCQGMNVVEIWAVEMVVYSRFPADLKGAFHPNLEPDTLSFPLVWALVVTGMLAILVWPQLEGGKWAVVPLGG